MNPIILGIETATDACSAALYTADGIIQEIAIIPQAHSRLILTMVDTVCKTAGIELQAVDCLAFGCGPGSFTGLRIAASVIQGLAYGLNKPVVAISSLRALAQQAANKFKPVNVLAIFDARMQEIYWGAYKVESQNLVQTQIADCLQTPAQLRVDQDQQYLAVGTGCITYGEILNQQHTNFTFAPDILYPQAAEVVQLALPEYMAGNTIRAEQAVPVYIRNNVASVGKKNPD